MNWFRLIGFFLAKSKKNVILYRKLLQKNVIRLYVIPLQLKQYYSIILFL
jgi:hypothetical protein